MSMRGPKNTKGLQDLIACLPGGTMVEIGCYEGESTKLFADCGKFSRIYAVDPWKGGYDDTKSARSNMKRVEREFDIRMGGYSFVSKMKMRSNEAAPLIDGVDFVYIDGEHSYKAVKEDILLWKHKCSVIGLHDYGGKRHPGVKKAIHEILGKPQKTFIDTSCLFIL